MDIEAKAKECEVPVHFIHGTADNIVATENSDILHAAWKGAVKSIEKFQGDHNDPRPDNVNTNAYNFVKTHLK